MNTTAQFIIILIACFLGLILGTVAAWLSREELKPGLKYFFAIQNILLGITAFLLLRTSSGYFAVAISAIIMAAFFWIKHPNRDIFVYAAFAVILAYSATDPASNAGLLIFSTIIFLYGLQTASITAFFHEKQKGAKMLTATLKEIIVKYSFFVALGIILYWLG